jgi:Protein of unknown function (DUF1761)
LQYALCDAYIREDFYMKPLPILVAGLAYFALGGLWFTPLFGKQWDKAVGFVRPPKWRPSAAYYLGPLLGCLMAALATAYLIQLSQAQTLWDHLRVGFVAGLGFGATITTVNAIAPNMRHPGLYAMVVGSYHWVGIALCSAVLHWLA